MRKYLGIIFFISVCSVFVNGHAFAEETYSLEIDEKVYLIKYQIDADVIAMAIDPELFSLLIGIENTQDSEFYINFPNELISADDSQFAVLVNGYEIDYFVESNQENTSMRFFVPVGSEEIEIIGTRVIPEFPLGASLIIIGLISAVVILSRTLNPLSNNFV